jgi:hypothetical protein
VGALCSKRFLGGARALRRARGGARHFLEVRLRDGLQLALALVRLRRGAARRSKRVSVVRVCV